MGRGEADGEPRQAGLDFGDAGRIMRGGGFGLLGNIIVGVVGAMIGGTLFRMIGLPPVSSVGSLISAVVGACVLLYLVSLAKKA